MAYFPFMIEVKGHKALVVGAGQSAKYKIRALSEFQGGGQTPPSGKGWDYTRAGLYRNAP